MAELKKCPFCGSGVKIIAEQVDARTVAYEFRCQNLDCCSMTSFDYCDREESIEAWNNRPTESEIRAMAIDEFAEKLKAELSEQIFSDEEKFKYARKEQEAICAQNATWKMAIRLVNYVAEQLKEET